MKEKDLIKLRCDIHKVFNKWFTYSRKHNSLYSDCVLTQREEDDLIRFLGKGYLVIVSLYSTYILPIESFL